MGDAASTQLLINQLSNRFPVEHGNHGPFFGINALVSAPPGNRRDKVPETRTAEAISNFEQKLEPRLFKFVWVTQFHPTARKYSQIYFAQILKTPLPLIPPCRAYQVRRLCYQNTHASIRLKTFIQYRNTLRGAIRSRTGRGLKSEECFSIVLRHGSPPTGPSR